ncbi:MAG: hypothetical protein WB810_08260, partial [Candidatus Cybelea sp.]
HLLRNLRYPRRLRRNPLACDAFANRSEDDALGVIGKRVDAALRAMDSQGASDGYWRSARQVSILLRVDMQRHDPHTVAADLGLSIRQFHRSRRAAHDRFFVQYRTATSPISTVEVNEDLTRRLLTHAASLVDSSEVSSATAILNDVANSGADAAVRCEALVLLAEVNAWAHRLDRAWVNVNAAEAILAAATVSDARRAVLLDASDAVSLLLGWFAEGPSAVSRVAPKRNGCSTQTGRAALVRAAAALRSGDAAQATLLLQGFNGTAASPEGTVDLLTLRAELADFTAENPLLSEELFTRAADAARIHGLRGRELYATHQLWLTRWAHSRRPQDRSTYRGLVDEIDRSLSPRLRSYLTFSAADVELALGSPERAHAAAMAAGSVSTNRYESFSAHGLAAGALLRLGRTAEAGVQARLAAEAARAEGHARVLSLAQRISAQAYLAQGDRRAARAAIEEAIECARHFSTPHVLAQAQRVLAMIIGR